MPMAAPPVPDWLRRSPVATPTPDANVHQGTQVSSAYGALHPETWGQMAPEAFYGQGPSREGGVEAVPFGSLLDPVSQAAFLAAPGVQALARQVLPQAGMSAPRLPTSFLAQQRGNLGRPPMNTTGELLPESMVRDEAGNLQRLYHGTNKTYPDFEMSKADPGGLYGPGVYMTDTPAVAQGYATQLWDDHSKDALRSLQYLHQTKSWYLEQAANARKLDDALDSMKTAAEYDPLIQRAEANMQRYPEAFPHLFRDPAQMRPVYADLKRPFDMTKRLPEGMIKDFLYASPRGSLENVTQTLENYSVGKLGVNRHVNMTGQQLYDVLQSLHGGDKAAVNALLQQQGYDGISHLGGAVTGGQPHKVWISFSSDNVYPSFNVDALKGQ